MFEKRVVLVPTLITWSEVRLEVSALSLPSSILYQVGEGVPEGLCNLYLLPSRSRRSSRH